MGAKKITETPTEADLISEVSRVITEVTGVQLGPKQVPLVQGRLHKRMRDLRISDPLEYSRYYNANQQIEVGILISLLTTHHTFFFREFQHFEYLLKVTIPMVVKSHREKGLKTIRIWSAACSRGQEVYSLSMFLRSHLRQVAPEMNFEIIGSDICEESIAIAKNGVYAWDELRIVPSIYLQGHWSKGSGKIAQYVRAKEEIRAGLSFHLINLQELDQNPFGPVAAKFDIIFCRNVFIYFNHAQIKAITNEMLKMLNPVGHLFLGLSESLNGLGLPIEWVGPSVYEQKQPGAPTAKVVPFRAPEARATTPPASGAVVSPAAPVPPPAPAPSMASQAPGITGVTSKPPVGTAGELGARKIRILCVDDSPTVILLLKRILSSARGFEVIGTAADGIEAAEKAKALKPDLITLDIHMPRMTGVQFLEKHFRELKTPVVVVSSVPRDDASLAYRCLDLGASDYIEKPSAQNLDKVDEELVFKLRVAEEAHRLAAAGTARSRALELDAGFRRPPQILRPEGKLRLIVCTFSSRDVASVLLKGFRGTQPGTIVLVEGAGELFREWANKSATQMPGGRLNEPKTLREATPGSVSFLEMEKGLAMIAREGHGLTTSALVVGPWSRALIQGVGTLSVNQLILEDRGGENPQSLLLRAHLVVPLTSFVYESDRFLAETSRDGKK